MTEFQLLNAPPGNRPTAQGILFASERQGPKQPKSAPDQLPLLLDDPEPEPCFPSQPIVPQTTRRKRCYQCVALVESVDASGYCAECAAEIADNQPCPSCFSFGCSGCDKPPRARFATR